MGRERAGEQAPTVSAMRGRRAGGWGCRDGRPGRVPEMRAFPANGRAPTSALENIRCQAGEDVNTGGSEKNKSGSVRGVQERWASEEGQHGAKVERKGIRVLPHLSHPQRGALDSGATGVLSVFPVASYISSLEPLGTR